MRPEPITVSIITKYIKNRLVSDEKLNNIYIKGEISNFKKQFSSGHLYFSLKDEKAVIPCIMFKGYTRMLDFDPKDGEKVELIADITVYEAGGRYQLNVKAMRRAGIGELYLKFEELKKKLEQKGYFKEDRKKKIPLFPKRIGVATSKTGAVIQDIINVGTKRNPNLNLLLYPVKVQGEGASLEIKKAIEFFNKKKNVDVIIIGRGGGSLEDLWAFNEEIVAEAIYESKIPIISAVGHETDFSISDMVSDLRAATPSQAAEFAVPEISKIYEKIYEYKRRYIIDVNKNINSLKKEIKNLKLSLKNPKDLINEKRMYISEKINNIKNIALGKLNFNKNTLNDFKIKLINNSPKSKIFNFKKDINILKTNITNNAKNILKEKQTRVILLKEKIKMADPKNVLKRGYILAEKDGKVITKAKSLEKNDKVSLKFIDGEKLAKIE